MGFAKSAAFIVPALIAVQSAWPDITLKIVDNDNKPIAGVSCSQNGNAPVVSNAAGEANLGPVGIMARSRTAPAFSLSRIALADGEKASLQITDTRGRMVLSRTVTRGERVEFAPADQGVYFARVSAHGRSVSGRLADLGRGFSFEGVGLSAPSAALAKSAAGMASVVCSKAGMPTQIYRLPDGATATINFAKLTLVPLYDASTKLEPETVYETPTAVITRWNDRARDRHAREDQYHAYDHYLKLYWEHRTAILQITDEVAKGGKKIRVDQWTQWPLDPKAREFRAFYRGIGTVAEYNHNESMKVDSTDPLHYYTEITYNEKTGKPVAVGDRMEIEVSQFLDKQPPGSDTLAGRDNYYGTPFLYIVGKGGLVPWEPRGVFGDAGTEREDSYPIPEAGWLGGRTTLHQQTSNEPEDVFMQMATNLAPQNGQIFVKGRRVHHTNFMTGVHDEPDNPVFAEQVGKAGPNYVNLSCTGCHHKNARAIPPSPGTALTQYVFKVGDAAGNPDPNVGSVFQPRNGNGVGEGTVTLAGWTEANGLRKPNFAFTGNTPAKYSARIAPQLVGMGLLDAVAESEIQALADPDDADKDGISGRMHIVPDYKTGAPHIGRFGWKAGKFDVAHQVAGALNTDIGVMTSIYPDPDCGSSQTGCGKSGAELQDTDLTHLIDYISLLGVRARRDNADATALKGEEVFKSIGCAACHAPTLKTSPYHPKAELRNQTIHAYTDLLLHDMGAGLASDLGEGDATGAEWRTAPLWNIGLTAGASGGEGYLHDGRARTLQEAILWHGGEGQAAMEKFKALSQGDSDALIKFLKSL